MKLSVQRRTITRHRLLHAAIVGAGIAIMSMLSAADIERFELTYTSIAANRCKRTVNLKIGEAEHPVSRVCAGPARHNVYVDVEDERDSLTNGKSRNQAFQGASRT